MATIAKKNRSPVHDGVKHILILLAVPVTRGLAGGFSKLDLGMPGVGGHGFGQCSVKYPDDAYISFWPHPGWGRLLNARGVAAGALTLLVFLPSAPGNSATLHLQPRVETTGTYTDNVRGVGGGSEADWINETSAGGSITADGNRLNLNLDINASQETHLDTKGLDGLRPTMLGTGDVELLQDHLFVDGFVSLSEVTASRNGPVSAANRNLPSNKRRLMTYSVDPRIVHQLGRIANVSLGYSYSETLVSQPSAGAGVVAPVGVAAGSTGDSKSEDITFELGTGPRFGRLDSTFEASTSTTQNAGRSNFTEDRAELVNEYQINRHLALIARGGYEDIGDPNPGVDSSGATWAGGVHLKPGPKLDVRIEKGRRYQGSNLSLDASYQMTPTILMSATFSQSLETQQQGRQGRLRGLVADPFTGELVDPITSIPEDPNSSDFSLDNSSFQQDLARFGIAGARGRNSFNFGADYTSRDFKTGSVKENQVGVNLNYRRQMQRNLSGSIVLGYTDILQSRIPAGGDTTYESSAQLSYVLSKMFTTSLEYARLLRISGADTSDDLSEDTVTIGIIGNF